VFSFLIQAQRALQSRRYDIVHAQGLTCWGADVITAHVCTAARLARASKGRGAGFARIVLPWERRFYQQRRARHLIGVSRVVESEIRACYGWNRPSTVIYHGTDLQRFHPPSDKAEAQAIRGELGIPASGSWYWLFVGEAVKGLSDVMAQLPRFPMARLIAVSRSDASPYLAQARDLGATDRFHFLGPRDDLERVYRAADVFVYPSTYDTFGMVVTEAMASGLPVIVGRTIGAAELIQDRTNGLLCDPQDPTTLTSALASLAPGESLAESVAREGRRTLARHDWDACAAGTDEVYQRMVNVSP
jgi:glycosyltransferase involved in cell wall biosynthesis